MMEIKVDGRKVSVASSRCKDCSCLSPMPDKGPFTQGLGYTSYYKKPKWVCRTRHLHGCPLTRTCPHCNTGAVPSSDPDRCEWCKAPWTDPPEVEG